MPEFVLAFSYFGKEAEGHPDNQQQRYTVETVQENIHIPTKIKKFNDNLFLTDSFLMFQTQDIVRFSPMQNEAFHFF